MEYDTLASDASLEKTAASLKEHNFEPEILNTKEEALERIKALIPAGASVMNGASRTLDEIGFVGHLQSGDHDWHNLHEAILSEQDPAEQQKLRRMSVVSDFYLGSVHALSETGEMVIASNTGSQLPHLVYTSPNIILVVSTKKITPTLGDALARLNEFVVPLEDDRLMKQHNMHTTHAKTLIMHRENPNMGRHIHVLLVKEKLGF
ncbi:MAG TPA: lactate utilization protein [Candidatus Paceibacterota bacterium]|nr:lactate utilization protein [Candidatus Paceibacterota bacterium]